MTAYYSEFDPKAAAWLRELVKQGHIAPGEVDERNLWDVAPADLKGFTQVHLCAGIGVWSYSLRRAGWPDEWPVWTGSFPCQPFSAAGKGLGFADERHLWPAGYHLVSECRPRVLFGEQVASKDAEPWLDLVQADLEALGYAFGACAFPSAGIGAPHIRDRTYWVADAGGERRGRQPTRLRQPGETGWLEAHNVEATGGGETDILADAERIGRERGRSGEAGGWRALEPVDGSCDAGGVGEPASRGRTRGGSKPEYSQPGQPSEVRWLADATGTRHPEAGQHERRPSQLPPRPAEHGGVVRSAGPVNGLWRDADWLFCRDGKWRPVEPGTFPLAHGAPARVGRLRGYGSAINAEAATAWISSYLESCRDIEVRDGEVS